MSRLWRQHLKDQGFTAIMRPSADFDIFTLVYEINSRYGSDNAFDNLTRGVTAPVPSVTRDIVTADDPLGKRERKYDASLGLKILSGLIGALGGERLGLSVGFEKASEITFSYKDVSKDRVSSVDLEEYLRQVPAPTSGLLERWLGDNLYVITTILKAKSIAVSAKDTSGQSLELNVPVIKNAVSGDLKVERETSDEHQISFEGATALPFAAQLFRLKRYKAADPDTLTMVETKPGSIRVRSASGLGFDAEPADEEPIIMPDVIDEGIGDFIA